MRIKILGVGGAINDGIPYNAFVINDQILCEAPPDIMVSLKKQKIECTDVKMIFISHFHADHCYGLPFLLLNQFYVMNDKKNKTRSTIAGPRGIKRLTLALLAHAFGKTHPCIAWTKKTYRFIELNASSRFEFLKGYRTIYFRMRHLVETYGFMTFENKKPCFAYTSDTLWCSSLERILAHKPRAVLIDLNGRRDDPVPVHVSPEDIIEFGLPITGAATKYFGTHLRRYKNSRSRNLVYTRAGMTIDIP